MVKVAVVGQVDGQFRAVINKLNDLQGKQGFAFVLFAGNVFSEDHQSDRDDVADLIAGRISIAVPIYFSVGDRPLPAAVQSHVKETGGEVCPNMFFLGRKGSIKTLEGARIVVLGGTFSREDSEDEFAPSYTHRDVSSFSADLATDILLTSDWPSNVTDGSTKMLDRSRGVGHESNQIGYLCGRLRPRYHFASSPNVFYEREPFFHRPESQEEASETGVRVTRFISLASWGNVSKQKWIYAFNLDLAPAIVSVPPSGATPCPLIAQQTRKRQGDGAPSGSYSRFGTHSQGDERRGNKRRRAPPPTPGECFFCLANPNIESHLITSIGNDAYVTTAKGPLPTSATFGDLGLAFPCHMLIIPLAHAPTVALIDDAESRAQSVDEMVKFRTAIESMIADRSDGRLGAVTWEVSKSSGVHVHWQIMPVPVELIEKGLVEAAFKVEAENRKYPPFRTSEEGVSSSGYDDNDGLAFFRVRIWRPSGSADGEDGEDGASLSSKTAAGSDTVLTLDIDPSAYFDLQFGRHVLAQLLGLDDRKQWKSCVQTVEDETAEAERFKAAFSPFDFSI